MPLISAVLSICQIVKLREDRSKFLERNETQASMQVAVTGPLHVCVFVGQNLSLEPRLEKSWDELQEKVCLCS